MTSEPLGGRLAPLGSPGAWLLAVYLAGSMVVYFAAVEPSASGMSEYRFGADSQFYLWYAGIVDTNPYGGDLDERADLVSATSNYLGPVLIATVLRSQLLIVVLNHVLFFLSVRLLTRGTPVRPGPLIFLLLLNPITQISLLTLNKEILALLATALLFAYLQEGRRSIGLLLSCLLTGLLARWQQLVFCLMFLGLTSRIYPLRRHRMVTVLLLVGVMSILFLMITRLMSEALGGDALEVAEAFSGEVGEGQTVLSLTALQARGLYFLVVLPKIGLNLYGSVLATNFGDVDWNDFYNSYVVIGATVVHIGVTVALLLARKLSLRSDHLYFGALYAVAFAASPFVQTRYFYPIYALAAVALCMPREFPVAGTGAQPEAARATA